MGLEQPICFDMKLLILTLFLVASVTSDDDNSEVCDMLKDMAKKLARAVIEDGTWTGDLFGFMKHKWDELGVAVDAHDIYTNMDVSNDDCIQQVEWDRAIDTIKKACGEKLKEN